MSFWCSKTRSWTARSCSAVFNDIRPDAARAFAGTGACERDRSPEDCPPNCPTAAATAVPGPAIFCRISARHFTSEFHAPLQVNSLVRTVEQQHRLRRYNRFAAPEWGDTASTHLAGVSLRFVAARPDTQQYAWITELPASVEGSGHGGSHRGEAAGVARCGFREVLAAVPRRSVELVGSK